MRIAGIDSGKRRDSFAFCGIEIKNDDIYITGVKTWLGRNYMIEHLSIFTVLKLIIQANKYLKN